MVPHVSYAKLAGSGGRGRARRRRRRPVVLALCSVRKQSVTAGKLRVVAFMTLRPRLILQPETIKPKTHEAPAPGKKPAAVRAEAGIQHARQDYSRCNNCGGYWLNPRGRRQACPPCFGKLTLYVNATVPVERGQICLALPAMKTMGKPARRRHG